MFFWRRKKHKEDSFSKKDILSKHLQANINRLKYDLLVDNEDIKYRQFRINGPKPRDCVLIYADNMVERELLSNHILRPMLRNGVPVSYSGQRLIDYLIDQVLEGDDIQTTYQYTDLVDAVLSGAGVILIDSCAIAIIANAEGWERRSVSEPSSENVVRGPRQGFTEDMAVNVTLVRRRIKSTNLRIKFVEVGTESKTKIALLYLDNLASDELVSEVLNRVQSIEIDGILSSGYVEELIQDSPLSPFPTIGNTERPDVVVAKLLEGRVALIVDGTPFALTMPYLFLEPFQANEDYYTHWIPGSFHRFLRYLCFIITTTVPAIYLSLVTYHPQLIPTNLVLAISASRKNVPFPAFVEVILMGLVFEILREGGLRLPQPIGEAMSIVGAIVLGDAAVSASLVSAPMIVVVAITGVSGFVISPLYDTAVLIRLFLVLLSAVLGLYGLIFGTIATTILLASLHSFGVPYLSSLTSFSAQDIKDTAVRVPWWQMKLRPRHLAGRNRKRMKNLRGSKK